MAVENAKNVTERFVYKRVDTRREWRSRYRILRPRFLDGLFEFLRIDGEFVEIPIPPSPPTHIQHDGTRLVTKNDWYAQVPSGTKPLFGQMIVINKEMSPPEVTLVGSPHRVVGLGFKFD